MTGPVPVGRNALLPALHGCVQCGGSLVSRASKPACPECGGRTGVVLSRADVVLCMMLGLVIAIALMLGIALMEVL